MTLSLLFCIQYGALQHNCKEPYAYKHRRIFAFEGLYLLKILQKKETYNLIMKVIW